MSRPSRPPTFTSDSAARGGSGQPPHAPLPFVDSLSQRLLAVCDALHFGQARTAEVESVFRTLVVPSTRLEVRRASTESARVSEPGAGNALIELTATLSPVGSELSVLFQPTGESPSPRSNTAAGMAMFAEAARNFGADLGSLERLSDLFVPAQLPQPCALWSAVAFAPGKKPAFKAYFKPQAGAAEQASTLVEEALRRVGMSHAWAHVAETMMQRDRERDEVEYLAFDLTDGPLSSVELCVRHHDFSPDGHARETDLDGHTPRGQVAPFIRAMTGGAERLSHGATLTCAAFVAGSTGVPPVTTHYVPVGAYTESDAIVKQRVCDYLGCGALSAAPYRRALDAFIENPFDASGRVPIWVAVGWCNGVPRFTLRLAAVGPGPALVP